MQVQNLPRRNSTSPSSFLQGWLFIATGACFPRHSFAGHARPDLQRGSILISQWGSHLIPARLDLFFRNDQLSVVRATSAHRRSAVVSLQAQNPHATDRTSEHRVAEKKRQRLGPSTICGVPKFKGLLPLSSQRLHLWYSSVWSTEPITRMSPSHSFGEFA
jgi:hypothetical protein